MSLSMWQKAMAKITLKTVVVWTVAGVTALAPPGGVLLCASMMLTPNC